jgi:hypothetical protein
MMKVARVVGKAPRLHGYFLDFQRAAALSPKAFTRAVSCLLCNSRKLSRSALSGRVRGARTSHLVHVHRGLILRKGD